MTEGRQRVCIAGIGGFAEAHHESLWDLEKEGFLRVVSTCDPRAEHLRGIREMFRFSVRGIRVFDSFREMIDAPRHHWAAISTPVAFHAPMHEACVEAGVPCYLEKPPTLDPAQLERMIALDERATRRTQVGFSYIYEPERILLKKRLLHGEFGRLERVAILGAWPRSESYYARSPWAGRLKMDEALLLDSCLGNAMSHHAHNILFFAGLQGIGEWGPCVEVQARLFRANPIEGPDTVFVRGRLAGGIGFRIALTHCCSNEAVTEEILVCENAVIRIEPRACIRIFHADGRQEAIPFTSNSHLKDNFRVFSRHVRGEPQQLMSTLADCRPFVHLNALAYVSAGGIEEVAPPLADCICDPSSGVRTWRIRHIEKLLERFVETGDFAVLQGVFPCEHEPGVARVENLCELPDVMNSICGSVMS